MIEIFKIGWSANKNVHALTTTRQAGHSAGAYSSFNLGRHVGDSMKAVNQNRRLLIQQLKLPSEPCWLNQSHSNQVIRSDQYSGIADADGCYTTRNNHVCAVLTADCLPVFIADTDGACVGLFHAGWRGLVDGILVNAVRTMNRHSTNLVAAIGPGISQTCFEVGGEVKTMFQNSINNAGCHFLPSSKPGHYYADLYGLAKLQLTELGVESVWLPESVCTYQDQRRFYSYRRDGKTGRMASLIWMGR